jgi:carboxyl-terminal processing protease
VADDFGHALGDPSEARLAAALALHAGGSCPTPPAAPAGSQKAQAADGAEAPYLRRSPLRENKWIDGPAKP